MAFCGNSAIWLADPDKLSNKHRQRYASAILLPNILLGLLFLFIVALLITMIYTLKSRVPFVPTPHKSVMRMIELANLQGEEKIYDLGAGDGRFLIETKKLFPSIKAVGVEMVPPVWLLGKLRILFSRMKIDFYLGNAMKTDVRDADCVFVYLIMSIMPMFKEKFDRELKPGTRVISNTFRFPGKTPIKETVVKGALHHTKIFVYEW